MSTMKLCTKRLPAGKSQFSLLIVKQADSNAATSVIVIEQLLNLGKIEKLF
jgi:hypothetical protein